MKCRDFTKQDVPEILRLYERAFPPEERRPYVNDEDFCEFVDSKNGIFKVSVCEEDSNFLGFLSYWTFSKFTYVEHFAVKPGKRRKGVGTFMLEELKGKIASQVLIEVELPSTPEAKSRIRFYEQRGFCINRSFDYVQPPYSQGLPEVSMLIMTHGNVTLESTADLSELIVNVYGAEV